MFDFSNILLGEKPEKIIKFKLKVYLTEEIKDDKKKFNRDIKKCELEVNNNMQLIEVIKQIEKEFNISFKEYKLFTGSKYLSEDNDNKLLYKLFSDISNYNTKTLFIYPKNELYEVTKVMHNGKSFTLAIHDSMDIDTIIDMTKEKNHSDRMYYLILNKGNYYQKAYYKATAFYYNMKKFD